MHSAFDDLTYSDVHVHAQAHLHTQLLCFLIQAQFSLPNSLVALSLPALLALPCLCTSTYFPAFQPQSVPKLTDLQSLL